MVQRAQVVLEPVDNATVQITVRAPDGGTVPEYTYIELKFDNSSETQSLFRYEATANPDGSYTHVFNGPAGGFSYRVVPQGQDYYGSADTGTVASGDTATIDVTLNPYSDQTGTVVLNVATTDGGAIPDGTYICYSSPRGIGDCMTILANGASSFTQTLNDVPVGNWNWSVYVPYGVGYTGASGEVFVGPDATVEVNAELRPYGQNEIVKTSLDRVAVPGETITWRIDGHSTGGFFRVIDYLPAGVELVSVTCAGDFAPQYGGACYDVLGNRISVTGVPLTPYGESSFSVFVTVRVLEDAVPGTVAANLACLIGSGGGSSYRFVDPGFGVGSPTIVRDTYRWQVDPPAVTASCSTATTEIVDPSAVDLSFVKELIAIDGGATGPVAREGQTLTYQFTATNVKDVPISGVVIEDPRIQNLMCNTAMPADLAPGAQLICTGTHVVDETDVARGTFVNTASVTSRMTPPRYSTSTVTIEAPAIPVAPTVTAVCGPDNDEVVVPDQPAGVGYTLTSWENGTLDVEFRAEAGYYLEGETVYRFTDVAEACHVTPDPSQTAIATATATSDPGTTPTAQPTNQAPTATTAPGDAAEPTQTSSAVAEATSTTSAPQTPAVTVTKLPTTGAATNSSVAQTIVLISASMVALALGGVLLRRGRANQ